MVSFRMYTDLILPPGFVNEFLSLWLFDHPLFYFILFFLHFFNHVSIITSLILLFLLLLHLAIILVMGQRGNSSSLLILVKIRKFWLHLLITEIAGIRTMLSYHVLPTGAECKRSETATSGKDYDKSISILYLVSRCNFSWDL